MLARKAPSPFSQVEITTGQKAGTEILIASRKSSSVKKSDKGAPSLSAREKAVLEFIAKGFTQDEIAKLLKISPHTVSTFVRRIYHKLDVSSKMEAVYEARIIGLIDQ